jgi:exopolyphosphatase/guanosine-5'-triphosphate,3'-diphosphate pyrophosphatase
MAQYKKIAVLEIGSSSVLLLLAEYKGNGSVEIIDEYVAICRLCENLFETGQLSEAAMDRTIAASQEMQIIAMKEGVRNLIVTATSSLRFADNRSKFLVKCHQALDIYPQVLSGKEEAKLTYRGVIGDLTADGNVFLINIGGMTTEIAYGYGAQVVGAQSLNIGSVMLTEKFNIGKSCNIIKQNSVMNYVKKELQPIIDSAAHWLDENNAKVIISGGVFSTYAGIIKKQAIYSREQVNFTQSDKKELQSVFKLISKMKLKDRSSIPGMEIGKAEIMPAGLLILLAIMKPLKLDEFSISSSGLRVGILKFFIERSSK